MKYENKKWNPDSLNYLQKRNPLNCKLEELNKHQDVWIDINGKIKTSQILNSATTEKGIPLNTLPLSTEYIEYIIDTNNSIYRLIKNFGNIEGFEEEIEDTRRSANFLRDNIDYWIENEMIPKDEGSSLRKKIYKLYHNLEVLLNE